MKKILAGLLVIFGICMAGWAAQKVETADLAIVNGKIYTANAKKLNAEAVAVKAGKILAVGTTAEIKKLISPSTTILDVKGKLVIPGLIDAHTHFSSGGRSLASLSFRGVMSVERVQEMVAAKIKEIPPGEAVFGGQYDHTLFPGQKWPTKEDLDKVSPDNPVVITRVDGHSSWVNSLALKQSGITKDTKDPFGGEVARDAKTGEPTGILKESAEGLIKVRRPKRQSTPLEDIERGLKHAASSGSPASIRRRACRKSSSIRSSRPKGN